MAPMSGRIWVVGVAALASGGLLGATAWAQSPLPKVPTQSVTVPSVTVTVPALPSPAPSQPTTVSTPAITLPGGSGSGSGSSTAAPASARSGAGGGAPAASPARRSKPASGGWGFINVSDPTPGAGGPPAHFDLTKPSTYITPFADAGRSVPLGPVVALLAIGALAALVPKVKALRRTT